MSATPTILPQDPRAAAFRWLVSHLQANPSLARTVKLWQAWDGTPKQDDPFPAGKACVRLTPTYEPETMKGFGPSGVLYASPVLVRIETQAPGSPQAHGDDAVSLWGLVQRALNHTDPATVAAARAVGVSWWQWVQPGADATGEIGAGGVRLVMHLWH